MSQPLTETSIDMNDMYEQAVHHQALYCARQTLELAKRLGNLALQEETASRERDAKILRDQLTMNETRKGMLRYIYESTGREDLKELMFELTALAINDTTDVLCDPKGMREACALIGEEPDLNYIVPEARLRQWELKFIASIQKQETRE